MKKRKAERAYMTSKLTAVLVLSALLYCPPPVFAIDSHIVQPDFSYFSLSQAKPIKLINPLYLDTTRTKKPVIKTVTPYNGEYNESDYFSSSIDESPPEEAKPNPPPVEEQKNPPQEVRVNDFFAPPDAGLPEKPAGADSTGIEPKQGGGQAVNPISHEIKQNGREKTGEPVDSKSIEQSGGDETVKPADSKGIEQGGGDEIVKSIYPRDDEQGSREETVKPIYPSVYSAGVDTEDDVDLEGRIISGIQIEGLRMLKSDLVFAKMKTQVGSLFNEELIQQDLQRIYAVGFFTDKMSVEPVLKSDGTVDLKFQLQENIVVSDVSIVGNTVISSMEIMPFIMPLKGLPQNISNINEAIDKLSGYYHNKGYILAGVSSVDDDPDGALTFTINEGVIDKIFIEGNEKTKDYVIERNIMTQPGTVYNENYLKEDLSRVYSTKIFKEVNREIYPSDTVEGEYNVKVVVKEDSPNSLALGGGIDNGLGAFGSVSYSENNFLGRGQRLTLSGILGSGILLSDASIKNRMNYQLELNFFEPHFLNADNSLMGKLYYRDLGSWQVPLAIERRFGLSAGVEHKVRGYNNLSTSFTAGIEHISMSEGDFNKIFQMYALRHLDIAQRAKQLTGGTFINLAPGVKYSTLDSEENPRSGIIANAKFIEAISLSEFKNTNGRLAGGVTKYFPVRKKSSFSLTARGGVRVHGDDMPEVMAFRLGGPYSIRGFRMSGVGTGDAFLMGSAELATPLPFADRLKWDFFQKIRLTFFVDAGKVFDPTISSVLYDRPMSAISAGVGLKVYIPGVGPISVDYGIPITNPGDYGSKSGYFTFGTGVNPYGW